MKSAISLLLLFTVIHVGAQSVSPQKKAKVHPCPGLSQFEMNECARKECLTADATLNKVYASLLPLLDAEEKSQLKEVQLIWIKYRDAHCNFVADSYKGGTMRPMVSAFCLADVTRQRTADLKSQIEERNR